MSLPGWQWLQNTLGSKVQNFLLKVLAVGPIPNHVAFVMDGNRRYARINHKDVQGGHSDGFIALKRMLEICWRLNIRCVSVYAFSIENFKRSEEEVAALMKMAEEKLDELCQNGVLLGQHGVRFNVVGKIELLSPSLQNAIRKAENMTRHNDRSIFNLCMPYTSRDEITTAAEACIQDFISNGCNEHPITEKDIDDHLMTSLGESPPLDILIRTSGVNRLSDFLLWQCCEGTQLQFTSTFWPEFGLYDFIPIILEYQRKVWNSRITL